MVPLFRWASINQPHAFRLCCYPVEEARTLAYPFSCRLKSMFEPVFENWLEAGQSSVVGSSSVKLWSVHECVMFIDSSRSERFRVDFAPPHLLAELDLWDKWRAREADGWGGLEVGHNREAGSGNKWTCCRRIDEVEELNDHCLLWCTESGSLWQNSP